MGSLANVVLRSPSIQDVRAYEACKFAAKSYFAMEQRKSLTYVSFRTAYVSQYETFRSLTYDFLFFVLLMRFDNAHSCDALHICICSRASALSIYHIVSVHWLNLKQQNLLAMNTL